MGHKTHPALGCLQTKVAMQPRLGMQAFRLQEACQGCCSQGLWRLNCAHTYPGLLFLHCRDSRVVLALQDEALQFRTELAFTDAHLPNNLMLCRHSL